MRTLIIGDIHGCIFELIQLLKEFNPQPDDKIIAAGDIIGRGSNPLGCLDILKKANAICLFGNHEYWLLKEIETGIYGTTESQCTYLDIANHLDYLKTFINYYEQKDYIVVHAGLNPQIAIEQNSIEDLVSIRYLNKMPWFTKYTGEKHIYFAHWAALGFFHNPQVTCLDGGCVYGNNLLAFCPEENHLYSIQAQQCYQPIIYQPHKS